MEYKCSVCSQSFTDAGQLASHMVNYHTYQTPQQQTGGQASGGTDSYNPLTGQGKEDPEPHSYNPITGQGSN